MLIVWWWWSELSADRWKKNVLILGKSTVFNYCHWINRMWLPSLSRAPQVSRALPNTPGPPRLCMIAVQFCSATGGDGEIFYSWLLHLRTLPGVVCSPGSPDRTLLTIGHGFPYFQAVVCSPGSPDRTVPRIGHGIILLQSGARDSPRTNHVIPLIMPRELY